MAHAPAWGEGDRQAQTRDQTSATTLRRRRRPKRRYPPEVLSNEEVLALLDACPDSHTGVRNRALLALLYRGGLRLGEALKLRPKDLDLEDGVVRVLHAKGGHSSTSGIDPGAAREVARWMALRGTWTLPVMSPVFCTASGRGVTQAYVRRLLPVLGARAGVEKRVHAHGLRHTHRIASDGDDVAVSSRIAIARSASGCHAAISSGLSSFPKGPRGG
jgi:site-specific recombinase XerD